MDTPTPQTPAPTPEPVKHRQLPLLAAILSFLVLSIIAALAYQNFILRKQISLITPPPINESPISPIPSISPNPSPDSISSDWKTYTDPYNKFSFQYPSSLKIQKNLNAHVFTNGKSDPELIWFELIQVSNPKQLTPTQYAKDNLCNSLKKEQEIILWCNQIVKDNLKPYQSYGLTGITTQYNLYENPISVILIDVKPDLLLIKSTGETGNLPSITSVKTLDQILSTFQFTK